MVRPIVFLDLFLYILSWTRKWISQRLWFSAGWGPFFVFCFLFRFLFFVSQRRQIDKTSSWLHPSRGWGVREGALVLAFLDVLFSFFSFFFCSFFHGLTMLIVDWNKLPTQNASTFPATIVFACADLMGWPGAGRAHTEGPGRQADVWERGLKRWCSWWLLFSITKELVESAFVIFLSGGWVGFWRTNLSSHGRHHRDMLNSAHAVCWPNLIWIVIKQVMHHSMSSSEISSSNKHSSQLQSSSSKMSTQELTSNLSELKSSMSEMKSSLSSHLVAAANAAAQSSAKFPSAGLLQGTTCLISFCKGIWKI